MEKLVDAHLAGVVEDARQIGKELCVRLAAAADESNRGGEALAACEVDALVRVDGGDAGAVVDLDVAVLGKVLLGLARGLGGRARQERLARDGHVDGEVGVELGKLAGKLDAGGAAANDGDLARRLDLGHLALDRRAVGNGGAKLGAGQRYVVAASRGDNLGWETAPKSNDEQQPIKKD